MVIDANVLRLEVHFLSSFSIYNIIYTANILAVYKCLYSCNGLQMFKEEYNHISPSQLICKYCSGVRCLKIKSSIKIAIDASLIKSIEHDNRSSLIKRMWHIL